MVYICPCHSLTSSQLTLPPPRVLKSILYVWVFIPVLPLGSSEPFFFFFFRFHIYVLAYGICFSLSVSWILISFIKSLVTPSFFYFISGTQIYPIFPSFVIHFFVFFCLRNAFPSVVSLTLHFCLQIFINFYIWLCIYKIHLEFILLYKVRI